MLKKEIGRAIQSSSSDQAHFNILSFLLPKAHAAFFLIPPVAAGVAATGGFIARNAALKWLITEGGKTIYIGGIGAGVGASVGKAINAPVTDDKKTSENEVQIKDAGIEPVPVPNPENIKLNCEKSNTGYEKTAGFIYYRPKDAEALKDQPINKQKVVSFIDFKFTYERHAEDPTKVVIKSILEIIKRADGSITGERFYKPKDEGGFLLEETNSDLLKKRTDLFYRGITLAQKRDCTGKLLVSDEVCRDLNAGNLTLARIQQTCNMQNPAEAIRQNKVENIEKKNSTPANSKQ